MKYIKEHFKYIPPLEIILNKEAYERGEPKDVIHYIPVTKSFQLLIEDKSFNDVMRKERDNVEKNIGVLKDFTDGSAFKENVFFKNNPGAYAGQFYSDSVELANPLGAAKGKHKINQVFWTLAQIPRNQRSKIDRMQLCMVYKDHLVKKYGYKVIFSTLIEDLKRLEEGIIVTVPIQRKVQLGLLAYSADNLEAHNLGGYSCCFSSKDVCRFCHASYNDLQTHIHDYDSDRPHEYWTMKQYDDICDTLEKDDEEPSIETIVSEGNLFNEGDLQESDGEEDDTSLVDSDEEEVEDSEISGESDMNTFGLRKRCPLNQLAAFHAVTGLPPDVMHDLMEGVISQVRVIEDSKLTSV